MFHRLASDRDFDSVYDLYMDEESNRYLTYDPMDKPAFKKIYNDLLKSKSLHVVEAGGEIVGVYRLIPKTDRQAHMIYLGGFTIKKELQGKGLGTQILAQIKNTAIQRNKTRIELTVDINNAAAIRSYKKIGFEIEGIVRKSYRLSSTNQYYDEYLMGLIL